MKRDDESPYLSPAELADLTERCHRADQLAWLKKHGWKHTTTALGNIRVLRAYRDRRLGATDVEPVEKPQPDFSAVM